MRYEELKGAYELPIDENDDIASMIDSVLSRPGLRLRYVRSGSDEVMIAGLIPACTLPILTGK